MADLPDPHGSQPALDNAAGQAGDQDSDEVSPGVEEEEEEEECRVCRGPSEEGRPLYAPCKCSGSIGLTHQDCLVSWLSMTRGNGRCELCSTKFRFAPKYAEGAPEQLPPHEVFLGLTRRALAKWLPFAVRFVIAMFMWLIIVPLVTAYLYQGWMHRPSTIVDRWKWELVSGDVVCGVVVAAVIIVSFLSLMSFGDFLRFHIHDEPPMRRQRGVARENDTEDGHDDKDVVIADITPLDVPDDDEDFDHLMKTIYGGSENETEGQRLKRKREILTNTALQRQARKSKGDDDVTANIREREAELNEILDKAESFTQGLMADELMVDPLVNTNEQQNEGGAQAAVDPLVEPQENDDEQDAARVAEIMQALEEDGEEDAGNDDQPDAGNERRRRQRQRDNDLNEPPFMQRDPMMNVEDPGDVDINVALDELLGLGAPFSALIRNVLWLLAFNTTYLGIFAFIPKTIGESIYSRASNSTAIVGAIHRIPFMNSTDAESMSVLGVFAELSKESERLNTTLRLPDLSIIVLGYFSMAFLVLSVQASIYLCRRFFSSDEEQERNPRPEAPRVIQGFPQLNADAGANAPFERAFGDGLDDHPEDEDVVGRVGERLGFAVECACAIVKVGVLLFFKMMLLPLLLGMWLDVATLDLFNATSPDRILFAGRDVFGTILLHWVAGITFMLLVTVSVLQLREVVHPDVLAPIIRPQEPQPDLLGNLLHEKTSTHAKRMLVSLGIYAALLMVHVWVPVRALVKLGIGDHLPFFRPKFWHILTPQLQIPLELIIFHLCMLAFLEKYKNHIGEMQHRWLSFMCDRMGLTDFVMPQSVEKFVLVGSRAIFLPTSSGDSCTGVESRIPDAFSELRDTPKSAVESTRVTPTEVDPFWYDLASKSPRNAEEYIHSNIKESSEMVYNAGKTKQNGARILRFADSPTHIRLPKPPSSNLDSSDKDKLEDDRLRLIPTTLGAYRLRKVELENSAVAIQFWKEVRGETIPRPPEGWDDLGAGGAEVQGRWAWLNEKKSNVEESVAARTPVFGRGKSTVWSVYVASKFLVLLFLSWFASSVVVCSALSLPLIVGRFILFLLRVPDGCIHDPVAFALGGSIVFPFVIIGGDHFAKKSGVKWMRQLAHWAISFRFPPIRKLFVFSQACILWFIVCPLCLGTLYDLMLVKSRSWFALEEAIADVSSMILSWGVGTLLLNAWALLCYLGAFTGAFWIGIGIVLEVQQEVAENEQPEDLDQEPVVPGVGEVVQADAFISGWQGRNGRIARFAGIMNAVFCRWEWDQVDPEQLLEETALPVATHLIASCWIPVIGYAAWLLAVDSRNNGIVLPVFGDVEKGLYRMIIFRSFAALALLVQFASSFQGPLQRWFRAAHKAARDDRYLVGQTLMNYVSAEPTGGRT